MNECPECDGTLATTNENTYPEKIHKEYICRECREVVEETYELVERTHMPREEELKREEEWGWD